jgi:hypothetical protein
VCVCVCVPLRRRVTYRQHVHDIDDGAGCCSQYETQLEHRREEQAQREHQLKAEAESRARDELARFYEERKKKADALRNSHCESSVGSEDRVPDSDEAAWVNVGKLIDMQSTNNKGRDTSRFKEILVSMRH